MEEKSLLNEITFLTRLIGQHKNELKSRNIASSFISEKITNSNRQQIPCRVPAQNLKFTNSRYCKVNHVLPQNILKQSTGTSVDRRQNKVQEKKLTTVSSAPVLHFDKTNQVKHCEDSTEVNKKKIAGTSSVHINPNFFTNTKNSQQEMAILRCKSVHVNPRLLGAVANNPISVAHGNEILPNCSLVSPNNLPAGSSQNKVLCAVSCNTTNVCIPKSESTVVTSQVSAGKFTNVSVPLRIPSARKKYVYQSKTKLVKDVASIPSDCKSIRKHITSANIQSTAKTIKTLYGGTLLAVSRTKLVRLPGKTRRPSSSKSDSTNASQTITKSRYRLRRTCAPAPPSPLVRTARKVCSKYRGAAVVTVSGTSSKHCLDHSLTKSLRKGKQGSSRSQYKVDHRSPLCTSTPTRSTHVYSHLLISPLRRVSCSNKTWTSTTTSHMVQKMAISHKKISKIGCNTGSRGYLQNSALVRIGGLLYKTSPTKLILSRSSEKKTNTALKPRTVVKRRSLNAGHIVYVRGNKFVMDQCGKTLKRVIDLDISASSSQDRKKSRVSRVDIGGVTYIQKTPSVLVRTNTHTARNVLSNAKQRSIAFLAQKMRKINTPCLFFRRFGRCPRQEKGRCELVHDPKYIDICKKFLQGKCTLDGCLLSHDVGPEKMPTCRFFLEGCCVRDLCPYLHVKVNDRAPICHNFLQGYCADGPECLKRHIMLCPEFDKKGSCVKGKYCPYPHSAAPRVPRAICSEPPITFSEERNEDHQSNNPAPLKRKRYYETESDELNEDQLNSPVPHKMKRYYETEGDPQETQSDVDTSGNDIEQSIIESPAIRRPKIGDLPSFIALESFVSD